jgi:hypothetical protein
MNVSLIDCTMVGAAWLRFIAMPLSHSCKMIEMVHVRRQRAAENLSSGKGLSVETE